MVVPPIVLFAVAYGRYVRKITKNVQDKLAESSHVAEEKFSNIRTVRAFAQEDTEMNTYNRVVTDIYSLARKEAIARSLFFGYVSSLLLKIVSERAEKEKSFLPFHFLIDFKCFKLGIYLITNHLKIIFKWFDS